MTAAVTTYGERLGIVFERGPGMETILRIPFHRGLVGRPGRLHGGAIGALLEQAVRQAIGDTVGLDGVRPRTATVDFIRSGMECDVFAVARIERRGRRLIHAQAEAWQDDRALPIATAHMVLQRD